MWLLVRKILPVLLVALYFLSPIDLIPDFFVGLGWIDDLLLVGLLIWFLSGRSLPLFARFGSLYGRKGGREQGTWQRSSDSSTGRYDDRPSEDDPYAVLGLRPGATNEQIKEAYRLAAVRYHPDKVSHLGKEFQELAHQRFVAIQEAYERLNQTRRS